MLINIEYAPYLFVLLVVVLELSRLAVRFSLSFNGPFDEGPWRTAGFDLEIDQAALGVPDISEVTWLSDCALADNQEARLRLTVRPAASKVVMISRHYHLSSRSDGRDE